VTTQQRDAALKLIAESTATLTGPPATEMKAGAGDEPRLTATPEFVERNRLRLCRSQEEIVARMKRDDADFLGFGREVLVDYLSRESAATFLHGEPVPDDWRCVTDTTEAAQDFLDYMVFAWMKAQDQRGISASRSILKLGEWLWLLGRDDLAELANSSALYNPYGAPALVAVCEQMGIPVPASLRDFAAVPE
jgi:hypothetical protein